MREETKTEKTATLASVGCYHSTPNVPHKLFTSDRFIPLDDNYVAEEVRRKTADGREYVARPAGMPFKGYGLEVETEVFGSMQDNVYGEVLDKIILAHFPKDLWKAEHDASLGAYGTTCSAELVTQIMTKEFIRNHYAEFKLMFNTYFPAFNISCAQSGNCGMHVNVSNYCFGQTHEKRDTAIRKLHYIINQHFDLFCVLLMRSRTNTSYCKRDRRDSRTITLQNVHRDRYVAVNFEHCHEASENGRVEIRIVGGQKNFASFRNTMEVVFHIVERVKSLSWKDCDNVTAIFKGCNQYVFDRLSLAMRESLLDLTTYESIRPTIKTVSYL